MLWVIVNIASGDMGEKGGAEVEGGVMGRADWYPEESSRVAN